MPFLLALAVLALATSSAGARDVIVDPEAGRVALGQQLGFLEDPERVLTVEQVSRLPLSRSFTTAESDTANLGLTRSAWWAHLRLVNPGPDTLERNLVVEWPLNDSLELFSEQASGAFAVRRSGDRLPFATREVAYRYPVFPITLHPGEVASLYLRVAGDDALVLPVSLMTQDVLTEWRIAEAHRVGAYYALLMIALFVNLAGFLYTRDRSFLHLLAILVGVPLWQSTLDGVAFQWFWPNNPWWANHSVGVFGVFTGAAFATFSRSFLLTKRYAPLADRILLGFAVSALLLAALALADMHWFNVAMLPVALGLFATMFVAAVRTSRQGFRPGRDFLFGFSFVIACLTIYGIDATFGLFQSGIVQTYASQVGFLLTALFLTVALGRRLSAVRRESELATRLRSEKDAADRENQEKSRILASASHDLRQPLHSLGLFVDSLAHRVHDPGATELIERIQASRLMMEQMFEAALDISKLDAGALEVQRRSFRVQDLLDELRTEHDPQAAGRGLTLRVVPSSLVAESDPHLLLRILRNLVTNALRYTDAGGVVVGVRRHGIEQLRFEVHDTGRGIPVDRRTQIFEEYRQIEGEGRSATEGLGLGLAIVDRLAKLLGHAIELRSTEGRGSVFRVVVERGTLATEAPTPSATVPSPSSLDGRVILVIEDDPEIAAGMRNLLGRWGCTVLTGESTQAALDAVRDVPPDLIVSDFHLSGTNGIEAISTLREFTGREVPALLVSGDTSQETAEAAGNAGLMLLHKPLAPARLRAAISRMVREPPGPVGVGE